MFPSRFTKSLLWIYWRTLLRLSVRRQRLTYVDVRLMRIYGYLERRKRRANRGPFLQTPSRVERELREMEDELALIKPVRSDGEAGKI